MKIQVNSSAVEGKGEIRNFFRKLAGIVDTVFKTLDDWSVEQQKETDTGCKVRIRNTDSDDLLDVEYIRIEDGTLTIKIRDEEGKETIKEDVPDDKESASNALKDMLDNIGNITSNTELDINDNPIGDDDVVEGLEGILEKLSGMLNTFFDSTENIEEIDHKDITNGIKYRAQHNDIYADISITSEDAGELCKIEVKASTGDILSLDNIPRIKVLSTVKTMLWQVFTGSTSDVDASRELLVTLKRVVGSREDSIELVAINANYSIEAALDTLDEVLEDEEILDLIDEEPLSLAITDLDESDMFDVEQIESEEVTQDSSCTINNILSAVSIFANNILMIHWNAKGDDFSTIHNLTDSWYWSARNDLDTIGELSVELCGSAPNPAMSLDDVALLQSNTEYTIDDVYVVVAAQMDSLITTLETYYVNFDHDVQSTLDNIIRYWKKERDYKVFRVLKD